MPKMKTQKSLARRVKITGRGKILHGSNSLGHLKRSKTKTRLRRLKRLKAFHNVIELKIKKRLGVA